MKLPPLLPLCAWLVLSAPRPTLAADAVKTPAEAAAEKRRVELAKGLEGAKLKGFVVLSGDAFATRKAALDSKAPPRGLTIVDTSSRTGRSGSVWKVLSDDGQTLHIESLPGDRYGDSPTASGHCSDGAAQDPFRVRAHARRADLQAVLVKPVKEDFADGTGFELAPGVVVDVPLLPLRGGLAVTASGLRFEAKVPLSAIGFSYAAVESFPVKRARNEWTGIGATFDDTRPPAPKYSSVADNVPIYLNDEVFGTARELIPDLREVQSTVSRTDEELLELSSPCLRLRVLGRSASGRLGGGGAVGLGGLGLREKRYAISKGSTAYYPDGSLAGEATGGKTVLGEGTEIGNRRCYRLAVGVAEMLCFASASIDEVK